TDEEIAAKKLQESLDPCPVGNMYARLRDSGDVAMGVVTKISSFGKGKSALISTTQFLQRDPEHENDVDHIDDGSSEWPLSSFDRRLFPSGVKRGTKVLLFTRSRCDLIPATDENVSAAHAAMAKLKETQSDKSNQN
ncbi:MAG: hypothetical protein ACRD5Z_03065, partial [Bryobacteraceae bacterium]